jgi:hypothetical protein
VLGLEEVKRDGLRVVDLEQLVAFSEQPLLPFQEALPLLGCFLADGLELDDQRPFYGLPYA